MAARPHGSGRRGDGGSCHARCLGHPLRHVTRPRSRPGASATLAPSSSTGPARRYSCTSGTAAAPGLRGSGGQCGSTCRLRRCICLGGPRRSRLPLAGPVAVPPRAAASARGCHGGRCRPRSWRCCPHKRRRVGRAPRAPALLRRPSSAWDGRAPCPGLPALARTSSALQTGLCGCRATCAGACARASELGIPRLTSNAPSCAPPPHMQVWRQAESRGSLRLLLEAAQDAAQDCDAAVRVLKQQQPVHMERGADGTQQPAGSACSNSADVPAAARAFTAWLAVHQVYGSREAVSSAVMLPPGPALSPASLRPSASGAASAMPPASDAWEGGGAVGRMQRYAELAAAEAAQQARSAAVRHYGSVLVSGASLVVLEGAAWVACLTPSAMPCRLRRPRRGDCRRGPPRRWRGGARRRCCGVGRAAAGAAAWHAAGLAALAAARHGHVEPALALLREHAAVEPARDGRTLEAAHAVSGG